MTDDWQQRWREGRIGWHEPEGNVGLKKHWQASGRRVFVPFCGKSVDLVWLAEHGNEVIGAELSELAVRALFDENGITYTIHDGEVPLYVSDDGRIGMYCGDFFQIEAGPFDACYDRGALIALPRERRPAYAKHMRSLLTPDAYHLLITVEYDQMVADGPPYSVAGEEVLEYWPGLERVDAYSDIENAPPKFIDAGLSEMAEAVWRSCAADG